MRKDTTFSDRKLTEKEFSDKYWMHGKLPYQYHTACIEDGRDEREQFLFNNCRALWERMNREAEHWRSMSGWQEDELRKEIRELKKEVQTLRAKLESPYPTDDGRDVIEKGKKIDDV